MNPTNLTFVAPTQYADGSPLAVADLKDWIVIVDGVPTTVPVGALVNGKYVIPLAALGLPNKFGHHTITVESETKNGGVSVPSAEIAFDIVDTRVPNPPTSLQVA